MAMGRGGVRSGPLVSFLVIAFMGWCLSVLYTQLTLESHGFGLQGFPYMCFFFFTPITMLENLLEILIGFKNTFFPLVLLYKYSIYYT